MSFPERVYTIAEHEKAREMLKSGYKHTLKIRGSPVFEQKVSQILNLLKIANYFDFFISYIREITEIDGLTQLRETEVAIWANKFAVENPVDAASLFVQKASVMKEYLEGELYYGGAAEKRSIEKRLEFLRKLKEKSKDENVRAECDRLLEMWRDSSLAY
jgi:hypothetical protein